MKYNHSEVNMVGHRALRNSSDAKEITYEQGMVEEISRQNCKMSEEGDTEDTVPSKIKDYSKNIVLEVTEEQVLSGAES